MIYYVVEGHIPTGSKRGWTHRGVYLIRDSKGYYRLDSRKEKQHRFLSEKMAQQAKEVYYKQHDSRPDKNGQFPLNVVMVNEDTNIRES